MMEPLFMTHMAMSSITGENYMIDNIHSRQMDIIKPSELDRPIRIIGAGGIGSWTALVLAKLGSQSIIVQDFDKVDESNTGSQIYSLSQIGQPKVEALTQSILNLTNVNIIGDNKKWDPKQPITESIVILALDSLETRKQIWEELKKNPDVLLVIDGRMAGDFMRLFFVPLDGNYDEYEKTLVSHELVEEEPCTGKAVAYNVFMTASIISNFVKLYTKGQLKSYKEFSFDFIGLQIL